MYSVLIKQCTTLIQGLFAWKCHSYKMILYFSLHRLNAGSGEPRDQMAKLVPHFGSRWYCFITKIIM